MSYRFGNFYAKIAHIRYTADNLPSDTDPTRMKPYPVTKYIKAVNYTNYLLYKLKTQ